MRKITIMLLLIASVAMCGATFAAEKYAAGMIMGMGEKLSGPQQAIMRVQLGASTQSGQVNAGEEVEAMTVPLSREKSTFEGLLDEDGMGPVGVSGTFIRKADEGYGIWVASSNNDYSPLVYANAFYTAGIRDSIMSVSSVEPVEGMMALGVAVAAYEKLNGTKLDEDDVNLSAREMLLTAELGKALEHYEMGAEVAAYVKGYAEENPGIKASEIASKMKERINLYERDIDESKLTGLSELIYEYASGPDEHSDMQAQLATLRAEQLWLVEPKERMMDEEQLAQADEELQEIIDYLDEEEKEPTFLQKNASWLLPVSLVVVSAILAVGIAYLQTRKGKKEKKGK